MSQTSILYPVFALAFLTFGVGLWLGRLRFSSVRNGDVSPRYYELNRGGKLPDNLVKVSHNYDNLLAFPILFYVLTDWLFMTGSVSSLQVGLAWVFVGSRFVHSYIHTTYNNVVHRMVAFMVGVGALILMWCVYLVHMLR